LAGSDWTMWNPSQHLPPCNEYSYIKSYEPAH